MELPNFELYCLFKLLDKFCLKSTFDKKKLYWFLMLLFSN